MTRAATSSLSDMQDPSAARASTRVAQVGYTAVIDRVTPASTLALTAANVQRSVRTAGGEPSPDSPLAGHLPTWQDGAVTVLAEDQSRNPFGQHGTLAFGISVVVDGLPASIAATAVLHEPSPALRAHAATLSQALDTVLAGLRAGADTVALTQQFTQAAPGAELLLPQGTPRSGDVLPVGALATSDEGAITYQTTVLVTDDGAERLDTLPLRLIELR